MSELVEKTNKELYLELEQLRDKYEIINNKLAQCEERQAQAEDECFKTNTKLYVETELRISTQKRLEASIEEKILLTNDNEALIRELQLERVTRLTQASWIEEHDFPPKE